MHASGRHVQHLWRSLACDVLGIANDEAEDRDLAIQIKAVTSPATTTVGVWAGDLVGRTLSEFITELQPVSAAGRLFNGSGALVISKPAGGLISVPGRAATPTIHGSFLSEQAAIPVRRAAFTSTPLYPHKMAVISTFTAEMDNASPVSFESILRKIILEDTARALDTVLVDANVASVIRPAGLANGAVVVAPAAAGVNAMATDIAALIGAIQPASRVGIIANPTQAFAVAAGLATASQGVVSVYPTTAIAKGTVISLDLDSLVAAADVPQFSVSAEALIHEDDAPTAISATGTPNTVAAPVRSLWQTNTLGIRMVWAITWAMRRTNATAIATGVTW